MTSTYRTMSRMALFVWFRQPKEHYRGEWNKLWHDAIEINNDLFFAFNCDDLGSSIIKGRADFTG